MSVRPPDCGTIDGGRHLYALRVHYPDTDAGGVVYHATYLDFADRARTELMRCLGWPVERLERETGLVWVVRNAALDLRRPARLGEVLVIDSRLSGLRGASIAARQTISRDDDALAIIELRLALVDRAGRPARLPAALGADLRPFVQEPQGKVPVDG